MKKIMLSVVAVFPLLLFSQQKQIIIKTGKLFNSESGVFETGMDIIVDNDRIEDVKQDKNIPETEKN